MVSAIIFDLKIKRNFPNVVSARFIYVCFLDQVRIHKFLERTKRKNSMNRRSEEEIQPVVQDQDKLRKKVNVLMKKQKLQQVRKIVKQYDDAKPWGQDNQVKVLHFVAFRPALLYLYHLAS